MTHRILGVTVFIVVAATSAIVVREARVRSIRVLAGLAPLMVLVQITLGLMSITSFLDVVPVTAHLGVAALLLGDLVVLHLIARGAGERSAAGGALTSFAADGTDLGSGVTA
jgi:heme A synthase